MRSSSKTFNFLVTIAASISLFILVVVVQNPTRFLPRASVKDQGSFVTINLSFPAGLNFFSIPLRTNLTADDICANSKAYMLLKWNEDTQFWSYRGCGIFGNNFEIEPNRGYVMVNSEDTSFTFTGKEFPANYKLAEGYNLVGFQQTSKKDLYASELCYQEITPTIKVTQVIKNVNNSTIELSLVTHICGSSDNNFKIEQGIGYFLLAENPEKPGKRYGNINILPKN